MTSVTKTRSGDRGAAATQPATTQPGATQPGATQPGATQPGATQPGATRVQDLLRERANLPTGHPDRARLRERSIQASLPLARRLADRYQGRGEPVDDLHQVAALALVNAVDGFDPFRPVAFSSYAVPTILGALKRYFRDNTWRLRVPRPVQDLAIRLGPARATLTQRLGRTPTLSDLAAHLDAAERDVAAAQDAWLAYRPGSLDASPVGSSEQPRPLVDTLGTLDARLDMVIDWHTVQPLVAALPARQRRILALRFVGELTQAEIAARIGVSQMHVSRLLTLILTQLRTSALAD